jgi:DNA replication licensing factor MCM2
LLQTFQKYLSFKKDNSELLFYILRQMTLDQLTYIRCVQGPDAAVVEVSEKDLIDRVSIVYDLTVKFQMSGINIFSWR